jgi:hypothetical protein
VVAELLEAEVYGKAVMMCSKEMKRRPFNVNECKDELLIRLVSKRTLALGLEERPELALQNCAWSWPRAGSTGCSEMRLESPDALGDKTVLNSTREALSKAVA